MGGGGAPPGQLATYPTQVTEWLTAVEGTPGDLTFDLVSALNAAKGTSSPWDGLDPLDPTEVLNVAKDALSEFTDNVLDMDPASDVKRFIDQATEKYDAKINSSADLDALVDAHDQATEAAYQRRVSGMSVGMWMQGAFMTTQFAVAGALIAAEREADLTEFRERLETANFSLRSGAILDITRSMLQQQLAVVQASQGAFAAASDFAKLKIIMTDDYQGVRAEFEVKRRTWDYSLLNDGTATIMSILGTQLTPRALTKGERLAAGIGTAVNTALNFGGATNPGAGLLAGLGSLGISALQGAFDVK